MSVELKTHWCGNSGVNLNYIANSGPDLFGLTNGLIPVYVPITTNSLNAIVQGTDWGQREGRTIAMKTVHVKGVFYRNPMQSAVPQSDDSVFVALVLDKACNGAAAPSQEVFSSMLSAGTMGMCNAIYANPRTRKRFKILSAKRIAMKTQNVYSGTAGTPYASRRNVQPFEFLIDLKGLKCNYVTTSEGSTPTSYSIVDSNLHLYAWQSSDIIANPADQIAIAFQSELRFVG